MSEKRPSRTATVPAVVAAQSRPAGPSIVSLLARTERLTDVLPTLHQRALDASGGSRSLLFEITPHGSRLQATSGFALDTLEGGPWMPGADERRLAEDAFIRGPLFIENAEEKAPDVAARLGTRSVCLIPLATNARRCGLLALGFEEGATPPSTGVLGELADDFVLALDLFRLRRQEDLHQDVRVLLDEFSATVSATLDLGAGLEIICHRARRLFGADRTSVWIHDRGARHLTLRASSDREHLSTAARVSTDDLLAPAAAAMRRSRSAAISTDTSISTVAVPLRGYRRALGAIVFDGVRMDPGGEGHLLGRADEVGRQLSSVLDSLQLIEEIGRGRAELESLFDAMPLLIAVADHRGRLVHANSAFANRIRMVAPRLRGRLLTDCIGEELAGWLAKATADTSAPAEIELTDPVLGGPLTVSVTARFDVSAQPAGLVLVARVVSDDARRKRSDQQGPQELQSQKLAALGQFVAGLAHELNNPLQGVLGHIDLLRATHTFPKSLRASMRTIYCEADRAAKIVRSLLMFAGSRRVAPRRLSLRGVLQKVIVLRRSACRSLGIEVVRNYGDHVPRVMGDPLLLHQVFLNMFTNAEQAIASTGKPGRIEISVLTSVENVTIAMRDTGPGIPAEVLPRLFEPFYTTKEVGQGTGLGLAIAYGIVHDHGGRITAGNHPDGGAVISVELPAAPTQS